VATTKKDRDILEKGKPNPDRRQSSGVSRARPGIIDRLSGEALDEALVPYLPSELIGGSIPHVPGTEEEAIWNAASQATGTERVHFVYTVEGGRCWYLACPSSSLASNPDSWCPLAAALPGNSEFWDRETVYLYEQEGIASALRWDPDTGRMQVFIGASRTLLPRIQSMDANFVTINPDVATPVAWKNRALKTEKLSRATARTLLLVGIGANAIIIAFMIIQFILTNTVQRDLERVKTETQQASKQLMDQAYNALQSDTIKHIVRVQELLDDLQTVNGTLVKYSVENNTVTWEVLVPSAYGQGVGTVRGEALPGIEKDGRVRLRGTN